MIFHYLQNIEGSKWAVRVITNNPTAQVEEAYHQSILSGMLPVNNIVAIDTGHEHCFPLLETVDTPYHFASFVHGALDSETLTEYMGRANFSWSNDSRLNFIRFDDSPTEWGLEPLGLKVTNHNKLSKRLNEVTRLVRYYTWEDLVLEEFKTPSNDEDIYYDGTNIMSRSMALSMGIPRDMHRVNVRVLTPFGLIKGDALIVDDLDVDLRFHTENLKSELSTDGWTLATAIEHQPLHEVRLDDQTVFNFPMFFPQSYLRRQISFLSETYEEELKVGGSLANFLAEQAELYTDTYAGDLRYTQLSDRLLEQATLMADAGVPPCAMSNITFTRLGALTRKMSAKADPKIDTVYKRMFVPASNALLGAVTTAQAIEKMGGETPRFTDCTYFDPRFGLVIPGERFDQTYDLHGGHDGDDTWCAFLIKLVGLEDPNYVNLVDEFVIDPNITEEGQYCAVMIRRPNGPGEYSIEAIDLDMPWCYYNKDSIPTIHCGDLPPSQSQYFSETAVQGIIPGDIYHEDVYTPAHALDAALAQTNNPGIGSYANIFMAWAATFGYDDPPKTMIANMEDVVDVLAQTSDSSAFGQIQFGIRDLWLEFLERVLDTQTKVDATILQNRIPEAIGSGNNRVDIGNTISAAGLVKFSDIAKTHVHNKSVIDELTTLSRSVANEARYHTDIAKFVQSMSFGNESLRYCRSFYSEFAQRLKQIHMGYRRETADADPNGVISRQRQIDRQSRLEKLVEEMVAKFEAEAPGDYPALALFKFILMRDDRNPHGRLDQIIVQPAPVGSNSMLHLVLNQYEDAVVSSS